MKTLLEFLTDGLNEAEWKSGNGTYNLKDAEAMMKAWKITIKQAYKALDLLDETDNPPKDIVFGKKFTATAGDDLYKYNEFEEEWEIEQ